MATEERVAVVSGVRELHERALELARLTSRLSPSELAARWWGGDPEASPRLRAVAERLDDCLAGFDALQRALGLPADREPRYGRPLDGARGAGRPRGQQPAGIPVTATAFPRGDGPSNLRDF